MLERLPMAHDDMSSGNAGPLLSKRDLPGKTACLAADDVCFEAGGKTLIDRLSLRLTGSGVSVVLGPNGAGKSLMLRLLHGLIKPSSGHILWNGEALSADVRARQAMVFQKPVLLRRSVAANVDFVLRLQGQRDVEQREALLELAGLSDHAAQPARALSGGEQQRLALVRALASQPDVLFLDEPTASLDPASILKIETIVLNARQAGTKIILVTHDVGQAKRLADDVVFVHRGRIAEHHSAATFFDAPTSEAARGYLDGRIVL